MNRTKHAWRLLDTIVGTKGNDSLVGTAGDDTIDGRKGRDTMVGGLGNDVYIVDHAGDIVVERASEGIDTVKASVDHILAANVEHLMLTGKALNGTGNLLANRIQGNNRDNTLDGAQGNDTLEGGKGHDTLVGGMGADNMTGGTGDDTYEVDSAGDKVRESTGGGHDTVLASISWTMADHVEDLTLTEHLVDIDAQGNALDNLIRDSASNNLIDGGDGNDTIQGGSHTSPSGSDTLVGGAGHDDITASSTQAVDYLYGGLGDDTLRSVSGVLYGEDGNDLLEGGMPQGPFVIGNTLYGGTGHDTLRGGGILYGEAGNDLIDTVNGVVADGGLGDDTILGAGGSGFATYTVDAGEGHDTVDVFGFNHLMVNGGAGDDQLKAGGLRNIAVNAGSGNDMVQAQAAVADDSVKVSVDAGEGNDIATGLILAGMLTIDGGTGDDWLSGASNAAGATVTVSGGDDDDTLVAGTGQQTLQGGSGADSFVLTLRESQGLGRVLVDDFVSGNDRLLVSQGSLPVGDGDLVVEGATTITGPGGFNASAELVLLAQDVVGPLTLEAVASAIGNANQAYAAGQTAVFVAGNGTDTWVLYFESSGNDAVVSAAELSIIGRLDDGAMPLPNEILWSD